MAERGRHGAGMGRGRGRVAFTNNLMFREVFRDDMELCRAFLERVLGFPVERVEEKGSEYVLDPTLSARGVFLDLYVAGSERAIDVEMESGWPRSLGRRMRYHQGAMDVTLLPHGRDFADLPESYVVFVCAHDPFGAAVPRYTMEPGCAEAPSCEIGSGCHWIALNAAAYAREADPGLRNLLAYVAEGAVDRSDPLVAGLDAKVEEMNGREEVMAMIWSVEDEMQLREKVAAEEARAEGEAIGEAKLSRLVKALGSAGRMDDIMRAADDSAYREALFEELAIE